MTNTIPSRIAVVVNMILINMMMAIINLAFEEIKENADQYQNKFELIAYIRRTCREVVGLTVAKAEPPVYLDGNGNDGDDIDTDDEEEQERTDKTSGEFTQKTDLLFG